MCAAALCAAPGAREELRDVAADEAAASSSHPPPRRANPQVAFGVDTEWTDRINRYEHIAEVRVAEFGAHADDEVLNLG